MKWKHIAKACTRYMDEVMLITDNHTDPPGMKEDLKDTQKSAPRKTIFASTTTERETKYKDI